SAVETKESVAERGQFEIADLVPRVPLGGAASLRIVAAPMGGSGLFQLYEHTVGARRMNKRHQGGLGAGSRLLIDQPHAARLQVLQCRRDVVDTQSDVV